MAQAFFNSLAANNLRTISLGTKPSDRVNPQAVIAMEETGLDINKKRLKSLTSEMIEKAD